jgi:hypothetical protein
MRIKVLQNNVDYQHPTAADIEKASKGKNVYLSPPVTI